ncbi:MAG: DUF1572 domain-containing protein [Saprospiraceae bacterium]|jgi:hypothetical protein|uniref:DUF1572 domain-containing protein n=1 Tax=Candidatus Brachybacter algidus TaxID=2982024 RepID=UPI001B4F3F1C|nr:DUF1572 domain-containing protein [Candidatus Brachybacter algidus]MBP7306460.1 DUF1572 domain-containing protein [Saprospiraceae bacterium]MBK6373681.1 DUF1572 domain-containing protein [Candidatus Brachybacter algidus]MBK6450858.1 DUF1572 domain-containing protein [Candidatus Brachybacter algidus]MBK7604966.1 DUF1572 domain-containing protein [Candidatus Brachybacter algidus]MBK8844859.1 DUF1572 domain-containing protein [Candidatus Brachybacter algidus]
MQRNSILAARLREVLLDGLWIANTNYKSQITTISWQQAIQKVGDLNSIAALTFHINYYLDGLLRALESGVLDIHDKFSFDMPPINSEDDWLKLRNEFIKNAELFVNKVKDMDESMTDAPFIDERYGTYEKNINGVVEHCYYHLGQVVIIRKMLGHQ